MQQKLPGTRDNVVDTYRKCKNIFREISFHLALRFKGNYNEGIKFAFMNILIDVFVVYLIFITKYF